MLFDRTSKTNQKSPGTAEAAPDMDAQVKRHRNRMAGMWAAELLGLIGHAAHDYARDVAHAQESTPDDEHVIGRLSRDLHGKVSVHEIREKLAHLVGEARRQLTSERKRD
ncbi:MAG: DUF1476 domain-containing protein [Magnetospirillum sp.]|nr:DUF1476 domain-containing protein [Magnetospirillum sp.]